MEAEAEGAKDMVGSSPTTPKICDISNISTISSKVDPEVRVKVKVKDVKEKKISLRELEGNLAKEIEREGRDQLINDAKLRALVQGTSSYEDFRQIWMAAHLKPMEKGDRLDAFLTGPGSKVLWNSLAQGKPGLEAGGDPGGKNTLDQILKMETKTPTDFLKIWKKLTLAGPEARFDYLTCLLKAETTNLATLWKEEVPSELLLEVIHVFKTVLEGQNNNQDDLCPDILSILEIISKSRRFGITLSFMTKADRKKSDDFFTFFESFISGQDEVQKDLFRIMQNRFNSAYFDLLCNM